VGVFSFKMPCEFLYGNDMVPMWCLHGTYTTSMNIGDARSQHGHCKFPLENLCPFMGTRVPILGNIVCSHMKTLNIPSLENIEFPKHGDGEFPHRNAMPHHGDT
jgi:hypothetical protein